MSVDTTTNVSEDIEQNECIVKNESVSRSEKEGYSVTLEDKNGQLNVINECNPEIEGGVIVGYNGYTSENKENKTRVTKGNLECNLPKVTLENKYSNHNIYNNNTNITTNTEYKGGYENTTLPAAVHNAEYEKRHANFHTPLILRN